jgi:hypothetical protein
MRRWMRRIARRKIGRWTGEERETEFFGFGRTVFEEDGAAALSWGWLRCFGGRCSARRRRVSYVNGRGALGMLDDAISASTRHDLFSVLLFEASEKEVDQSLEAYDFVSALLELVFVCRSVRSYWWASKGGR